MSEQPENQPSKDELFNELYDELKKIAGSHMKKERSNHTLQPTALVNEAYLRITKSKDRLQWNDRKHFLCAAADIMRRVLIDSARASKSQKRGGEAIIIELSGNEMAQSGNQENVLSLHEALLKFEKQSPKKAQLVSLRYFAGLTLAEAADVLDISVTTASNYWFYGRAWLHRELTT